MSHISRWASWGRVACDVVRRELVSQQLLFLGARTHAYTHTHMAPAVLRSLLLRLRPRLVRHGLSAAFSSSSSSSSEASAAAVELAFDRYAATAPVAGTTVIMHGALGSGQNWRSLARAVRLSPWLSGCLARSLV